LRVVIAAHPVHRLAVVPHDEIPEAPGVHVEEPRSGRVLVETRAPRSGPLRPRYRDDLGRGGLAMSTPDTSPTNKGCICRIGMFIGPSLSQDGRTVDLPVRWSTFGSRQPCADGCFLKACSYRRPRTNDGHSTRARHPRDPEIPVSFALSTRWPSP
jgi:hypothetical protein